MKRKGAEELVKEWSEYFNVNHYYATFMQDKRVRMAQSSLRLWNERVLSPKVADFGETFGFKELPDLVLDRFILFSLVLFFVWTILSFVWFWTTLPIRVTRTLFCCNRRKSEKRKDSKSSSKSSYDDYNANNRTFDKNTRVSDFQQNAMRVSRTSKNPFNFEVMHF